MEKKRILILTLGAGVGLEKRRINNNKNDKKIYEFSEDEINKYPEELFNKEKVENLGGYKVTSYIKEEKDEIKIFPKMEYVALPQIKIFEPDEVY